MENKYSLNKTLPIGINETGFREEFDSMGKINVPADRYWGAQTQRSLQHFNIGNDLMPKEVYHAYGYIKKACALVNCAANRLPEWKKEAIVIAADETINGQLDEHYPLYVWQTGSGTQSNMNVNEVISNRAIQLLGGTLGSQSPIGPNDDVNMGQSSNDTFPTAMHIAAIFALDEQLIPSIESLIDVIEKKASTWMNVVKIGRTHLEDAVPLTVGQEWYGWAGQLRDALEDIKRSKLDLYKLAVGGTAVGTGLNAPAGFSKDVADKIAELTQKPFITAPNKFTAQGSLDALVRTHASIRGLAVALIKIANDMRWLASGPRCGFSELILPSNEPGSSIMPGKVNPTQCEAIVMIGIQVMGNDTAIAMSGSQGNFELNAMRPVIINNLLHSIRILADGCHKFREFSVEGTQLNTAKITEYVDNSVMLVTALSPIIGYQNAAHIAENAIAKNITLKESAIASGKISEEDFNKYVNPIDMTGNGLSGA
ncbi:MULTISPECIES: class II fumarate hydratase [Providencia]|uniref:Fumarate hydratase class II n=4 Tax=Providencia stuartii TaxID=588 RepID=A0AAJ1N226_PROST|nr:MULTISPECIES: class II fumarate hydratase [Providencia]AFH92293.1 fumarate hydratase [Providencia stuartii MRSN 2154]AIN65147.1 fumarate hydratase, class II [Providencia stuartii]AMG65515.1 class II fumarate hydratase [Providencia stuartii]APG50405.1 fumarate hydratase, class II [Providencia stuartii]AVL39868.1 class II fumarate hydratase [Providencia stuartii]